MITKDNLLTSINSMPNEFSVEDIIDRVLILEKIEQGDNDSKNGDVYTEKEAKNRLKKWLM
ncbi:MAG: hypothetical protein KAG37_05325 [Flavobacteriales bacterium]|nr:hypothetical protein [Flavobacteriales bacterium]